MQCGVKRAFRLTVFLIPALVLSAGAQQGKPEISEDDIEKHFSKSPECEGFNVESLEYFDFTGDGRDEAVVVASTCATGTAGPDVHAVLSREPNGSIVELKIPELTDKQMLSLFGRVFNDLNVENGLLVATYHDESGRDDPLVIKYRWNGHDKEFQVAEVKVAPRYKASFDCDEAKTAVENAICYSANVSGMDVTLDQRYKGWLDYLNDADSDILMTEQKKWLRERDLICGNDRETFDCLEILYRARILEIEHFRDLHPKASQQ